MNDVNISWKDYQFTIKIKKLDFLLSPAMSQIYLFLFPNGLDSLAIYGGPFFFPWVFQPWTSSTKSCNPESLAFRKKQMGFSMWTIHVLSFWCKDPLETQAVDHICDNQ